MAATLLPDVLRHDPTRPALFPRNGRALFEVGKLEACSPFTVIVLPGNTSHFRWAKSGDYITQVTAIGPLGIEYVNSDDDPRNRKE